MSPLPLAAVNHTLNSQSPSSASNASGTISNNVFGVLAVIASIIGIWQARKAWHIWREHHPPLAVTHIGSRSAVESHELQVTDPVHQDPVNIPSTDVIMAPSPHSTSSSTAGDSFLPLSSANNHNRMPQSTFDFTAPTAALPASRSSSAEDPTHATGQKSIGMNTKTN